ncbi:hypothetical protein [Sphingobacterium kyonggiense]
MKKLFLSSICAAILFSACNNSKEKSNENQDSVVVSGSETVDATNSDTVKTTFNLDDIPVSTAELGEFPFFTTIEGTQFINDPKVKSFDFLYVALPDGSLVKKEGKVFRAFIQGNNANTKEEITTAAINKHFEDAITKAGGMLIHEGRWSDAQINNYDELASYKGSDGTIDVYNNPVKTFVIHRNDGNIYIQLESKSDNAGTFQIVQETATK